MMELNFPKSNISVIIHNISMLEINSPDIFGQSKEAKTNYKRFSLFLQKYAQKTILNKYFYKIYFWQNIFFGKKVQNMVVNIGSSFFGIHLNSLLGLPKPPQLNL